MRSLANTKRAATTTSLLYLLVSFFAPEVNGNPVGLSEPTGLQATAVGPDISLSWNAGAVSSGKTLSSGALSSCAIDNSGAAWCWGASYGGRLGNGSTANDAHTGTPTEVVGDHVFTQISVGNYSACALDTNGAAWCWGESYNGILGNGSTANDARTGTPTKVVGEHVFTKIAVGPISTCALDTSGAAWCWGASYGGRLGNGSTANDAHTGTPTEVVGDHVFTQISVGGYSACALDTNGTAWCWGESYGGILGNGSTANDARTGTPTEVVGDHTFTQITVGSYAACALDSDEAAWCWGESYSGILGNGSTANDARTGTPVKVVGEHNFAALASADGTSDFMEEIVHNCAVTVEGAAWCWGASYGGRLGNGSTANDAHTGTPTEVVGNHAIDQLSISALGSCAVDTVGVAWCWGESYDGFLGNGSTANDARTGTPNQVVGGHIFYTSADFAISGYRVEYSADNASSWNLLTENTESTETNYSPTGLPLGETYLFRVAALNQLGSSDFVTSANSVTPIGAALNFTFGTPSSTVNGFTVQVSNYSGDYTWTVTTTAGSATISDSGLVTVIGLAPGESATITVTTTRTGYNSGSAQVSASAATGSALTPTFGTPSSTVDGFTFQVSNYNAVYAWTVTSTAGSATISDSGLVTVTGLAPGESATVTVTATRTGYDNGSGQISGSAVADSDGDGVNDDNDAFPFADTEETSGAVMLATTPPNADSSCSLDSLSIDTVATESAGVAVNGSGVGISFSLSGCDTGSLETLSIAIDLGTAPAEGSVAIKIDSDGNWSLIEGATIEGSVVTYTITDNGPLDEDPDPGTMADPMTVAIPYSEPALPVPTLPALLLGLMSLLLGLFGYRRLAH